MQNSTNIRRYPASTCTSTTIICPTSELTNGLQDDDCIFNLLQLTSTHGNCQQISVRVARNITQQIDEAHYIAIFPSQTKIQTVCADRNDFMTLKGNYLINLPFGCLFQTSKHSFINEKIISSGQPMLLPEVKIPHSTPVVKLPKITIKDVPLDKIHELQKEQRKMEPIELIHHDKPINYWTIPIYVILILIGLYYLYKYLRARRSQPRPSTTEEQPQASPQAFFTP